METNIIPNSTILFGGDLIATNEGGMAIGGKINESKNQLEMNELRHKYSAFIIKLDTLRAVFNSVDCDWHPNLTENINPSNNWSVKEILGHIIDTDREIWGPRIERILNEDYPYFEDIDPIVLVLKNGWRDLPLEDIVAQAMRVRWKYAIFLNNLPAPAFEKKGLHCKRGEMTLVDILSLLVTHDNHYIEEIHNIVRLSSKTQIVESLN